MKICFYMMYNWFWRRVSGVRCYVCLINPYCLINFMFNECFGVVLRDSAVGVSPVDLVHGFDDGWFCGNMNVFFKGGTFRRFLYPKIWIIFSSRFVFIFLYMFNLKILFNNLYLRSVFHVESFAGVHFPQKWNLNIENFSLLKL